MAIPDHNLACPGMHNMPVSADPPVVRVHLTAATLDACPASIRTTTRPDQPCPCTARKDLA